MKKIYTTPAVCITAVDTTTHLLSNSEPQVTLGSGSVNAADVEVKDSIPSYNVWNDNWSE